MKWSLGFSSVGCVWVFYLPCIYPFPPWVWICHTFFVFTRNVYNFYIFFLFLWFFSPLTCFAHCLCPVCCQTHSSLFHFPKTQCHPRQGLCLGNIISFIVNYWLCAHGLAQPLTRSPCSAPAMLFPCLFPVPFFSPRMSLVLDLPNCCPASSIMSDSSVAYFNSYFLAIIVGRQKSIFYLLVYVLTNFKKYKIKMLLQLLRILCRFPPLPIWRAGDFGEWGGRRGWSQCEFLGFRAVYKVKYYCMPSQSGILSHWKSPMLSVLRRLRSTLLILLLAGLICNPFRMCSTDRKSVV